MRESLYDYCTRTRRQALLEEWDVEGNGAPVAGGGLHPDGSGERLPVLRGEAALAGI